MITTHARTRAQQRGLPPLVLHWLDDFGREVPAPGGATLRHFDKRARRRLERSVGREPVRRLHEYLDAYAVYADDGTLVTTGHRYQRIRRKE
jgi:hypothetical protein